MNRYQVSSDNNNPIVVQGTPVGVDPVLTSTNVDIGSASEVNWEKGVKQPKQCRDCLWAVLFYAQLAVIIGLIISYTPPFLQAETDENIDGVIKSTLILGAFAMVLTGILVNTMICSASILIKFSLISSIVLSLFTAIVSVLNGPATVAIFGFIFFAIGICYACAVWKAIPFATANLITAVHAVRANAGLVLVAYIFLALAFIWSIIWTLCVVGLYNTFDSINNGYIFLLFVSYFWTHQVIQNTVHVTVAGVVGTWWYAPNEASSCCSKALCDSFCRSTTLSFGSICLGSLIVAILQALRQLAYQARQEEGGGNLIVCIAECILSCIENLMEYFNKWAYVYVGLYGYSYMESGTKVMTLFRARGWENIIADTLVSNALFLTSLGVALITGGVGLAIDATQKTWFDSQGIAFVLGFIIGLVLSSILLSLIASAVNTVLVCFAEGPRDFQTNHPELSNRMIIAWRRSGICCI